MDALLHVQEVTMNSLHISKTSISVTIIIIIIDIIIMFIHHQQPHCCYYHHPTHYSNNIATNVNAIMAGIHIINSYFTVIIIIFVNQSIIIINNIIIITISHNSELSLRLLFTQGCFTQRTALLHDSAAADHTTELLFTLNLITIENCW